VEAFWEVVMGMNVDWRRRLLRAVTLRGYLPMDGASGGGEGTADAEFTIELQPQRGSYLPELDLAGKVVSFGEVLKKGRLRRKLSEAMAYGEIAV
jgi:hypothetical protein